MDPIMYKKYIYFKVEKNTRITIKKITKIVIQNSIN